MTSGKLKQKGWFAAALPFRHLVLYVVVGAFIGVIILHPLNTLVVWMEFEPILSSKHESIASFARARITDAPLFHLITMNGTFAGLGAAIGGAFALLTNMVSVQTRAAAGFLKDLQLALPSVIAGGENEYTEFKATLRWDIKETRTNRSLEQVVAKTLAGLMNTQGGRLLIGVADNGDILGLDADLQTLRDKSPDGFERALTGVIKTYLGGAACTLVRCRFLKANEKLICWVLVEQGSSPVFLALSGTSKYYVRAGNATRELNVAEAHDHIQRRGH